MTVIRSTNKTDKKDTSRDQQDKDEKYPEIIMFTLPYNIMYARTGVCTPCTLVLVYVRLATGMSGYLLIRWFVIFCRHLSGDHSPPDWRGGLDIDYNIGPGFNNSRW